MRTKAIILALLLAVAPWAEGQLSSRLDGLASRGAKDAPRMVIPTQLELEPISLQEVYERVGGGASTAQPTTVDPVFEREAVLWTACVRHKKDISKISPSYELVTPGGDADRLAHADAAGASELRITITPLPPRALGRCPTDRKYWLYEGRARILMDASKIKHAGRYAGTLIVVLNSL